MNITTKTTIVSNEQLDDNTRERLLEEEGFKSTPETRKCWRRNNNNSQCYVYGQTTTMSSCYQSPHVVAKSKGEQEEK